MGTAISTINDEEAELFVAQIRNQDLQQVADAVRVNRKLLTRSLRRSTGDKALHLAAAHGSSALIRGMMEAAAIGTQVDKGIKFNSATLHVFHAKLANQENDIGRTALMMACEGGHYDCVATLLEYGADPWAPDKPAGLTCMHYAAIKGHCSILELITEFCKQHPHVHAGNEGRYRHGVYDVKSDASSLTPLHYAVWHRHAKAVTTLTKLGASIYSQTEYSSFEDIRCNVLSTPLHIAAMSGSRRVVKAIMRAFVELTDDLLDPPPADAPVDPRLMPDSLGNLPFIIALQRQNFRVLELLHPLTPLADLFASEHPQDRAVGVPRLVELAALVAQPMLLQQVEQLAGQASKVYVNGKQQQQQQQQQKALPQQLQRRHSENGGNSTAATARLPEQAPQSRATTSTTATNHQTPLCSSSSSSTAVEAYATPAAVTSPTHNPCTTAVGHSEQTRNAPVQETPASTPDKAAPAAAAPAVAAHTPSASTSHQDPASTYASTYHAEYSHQHPATPQPSQQHAYADNASACSAIHNADQAAHGLVRVEDQVLEPQVPLPSMHSAAGLPPLLSPFAAASCSAASHPEAAPIAGPCLPQQQPLQPAAPAATSAAVPGSANQGKVQLPQLASHHAVGKPGSNVPLSVKSLDLAELSEALDIQQGSWLQRRAVWRVHYEHALKVAAAIQDNAEEDQSWFLRRSAWRAPYDQALADPGSGRQHSARALAAAGAGGAAAAAVAGPSGKLSQNLSLRSATGMRRTISESRLSSRAGGDAAGMLESVTETQLEGAIEMYRMHRLTNGVFYNTLGDGQPQQQLQSQCPQQRLSHAGSTDIANEISEHLQHVSSALLQSRDKSAASFSGRERSMHAGSPLLTPRCSAQPMPTEWQSPAMMDTMRQVSRVLESCSHIDEEDWDNMCGVCLDNGQYLAIKKCGHKICASCAKELLKLHDLKAALCPFCRQFIWGFELWPAYPHKSAYHQH